MPRILEIVLVLVLAPVWVPLLLALALVVWWRLGRPVLFAQVRPGRRGKLFTLVKFRTMTDARGPDGALLPDADRLPRFGHWLRATSLDELPELLAVLRGDMSLVGPRPLLPEYLPLYSARHARRHEVRPGLTGWAQVHGRNAIGWADRFDLDVWYVDHRSLCLDVRILALTIWRVLGRHGVSAPGEVTMPRFNGYSTSPPTA